MKMEQTECSETSAYKIQTPGELPRRKYIAIERNSHRRAKVILRVKVVLVDIYPKQSRARAAMLPSILRLSHSPINPISGL